MHKNSYSEEYNRNQTVAAKPRKIIDNLSLSQKISHLRISKYHGQYFLHINLT